MELVYPKCDDLFKDFKNFSPVVEESTDFMNSICICNIYLDRLGKNILTKT